MENFLNSVGFDEVLGNILNKFTPMQSQIFMGVMKRLSTIIFYRE